MFHAPVGYERERKVQLAKILKPCEHLHIGVGHPTEAKIYTRDPGTRVGLDNAAPLGHPLSDVSSKYNRQENQWRNQRSHEPKPPAEARTHPAPQPPPH